MSKIYYREYECKYCGKRWKEAKDKTAIMDSFGGANGFCSNGCAVAYENKIQAERSRKEAEKQALEIKRNDNLAKVEENSRNNFSTFDESSQNRWAQRQQEEDFDSNATYKYTSTKKSSTFMKIIKVSFIILFILIFINLLNK